MPSRKILLVGCPNAGKSAVFNLLTGQDRKVANYSGVTVDFATAPLRSNAVLSPHYELVDLPGIYSLCPHTDDEAVTVAALVGENRELSDFYAIVVVLDFVRIQSSLKLLLAIRRIWSGPLVAIVNKCDNPGQRSKIENAHLENLVNIPLLPISALSDSPQECDHFLRDNLGKMSVEGKSAPLKLSARALEEFREYFPTANKNSRVEVVDECRVHDLITVDSERAEELAQHIHKRKECRRYMQTLAVDRVLLHPLWGMAIFFLVFYLLFLAIYSWSAPFMSLIDVGVNLLTELLKEILPSGVVQSFITDGVVSGVGASLVFVPQIFILFFLISILNQSGYIARASILTDKVMSRFGLNGKAFLPFLSGFACSVPAIMATRIIKDRRERMATMLVIPFITCSARLPVYILLVGTFVTPGKILGVLDRQALAFFFLYFIGTVVALVFAKLFRLTLFQGKSSSFVIELPHYQTPQLRQAIKEASVQGRLFLRKVGTIILFFSMIIWLLSSFPKMAPSELVGLSKPQQQAKMLENSYLGRMGKSITPLVKPIGFDWKISVGLLSAFAARELFVSTMGTLYALGDVSEESSTLRERMRREVNPQTGQQRYSTAVVWSLLLFFAFACQCMSTLAIIKRESGKWRYVIGVFAYMFLFAYLLSYTAYQILS